MDISYKQEVGVGVLVLGAVALFVALMLWFTGGEVNRKGVPVRLVFATAAGLEKGDPVMVSGVKKGRVASVVLERPGRVLVTIDVDPDVAPKLDASATMGSLDFFGAKFIDYFPGERAEALPDSVLLVGGRMAELTDIAGRLGGKASELLDSAQALVSSGLTEDLHATLVSVQRAMEVIARVGGGPLVGQTTATLQATERLLTRTDSILGVTGGARLDTLMANLSSLSVSLAKSSASLDTLMGMLRRGEGTLGRMATDTMLYVNLTASLNSLNLLLTDLRERPGRYLTVKVF
jgi:phospholipid/cholesterol/gamma-HCH transport system substrate-binding protein